MADQQQYQQQQGTEYTLQGVMRYLQVEWHNHERARNAWDIERAELKARVAKTEGDYRAARRLNGILDRHVKFLETALRAERRKLKASPEAEGSSNHEEAQESKQEENGEAKEYAKPDMTFEVKQVLNGVPPETAREIVRPPAEARLFDDARIAAEGQAKFFSPEDREKNRERTQQFLQKGVEELVWIFQNPRGPAQSGDSQGSMESSNQQLSADELYAQQAQMSRNQQAGVSHLPTIPSSAPNHHPTPVRQPSEYVSSANQPQSHPMARQPSLPPPSDPPPLPEDIAEMRLPRERLDDRGDRPELSSQSFDPYARQVTTRTDEIDQSQPLVQDENDGWNFDDDSLDIRRATHVDVFPSANSVPPKSPTRTGLHTRRRSSGSQRSARRPSDGAHEVRDLSSPRGEPVNFKVQFALRGHLDVIRSIIFTGYGSPSEPEICTASDDGTLKRWHIPAKYSNLGNGHNQQHSISSLPDLDLQSNFTHRGHDGIVTSLAACPPSPSFSTGGRALGDGWVFSGGSDATIRVWERGRVDPKATIEGHTDAIWALSVLPAPASSILGSDAYSHSSDGSEHRILLVSGSADSTVKIWAVTAPPQLASPQSVSASRRGVGGTRRHSITSGSNWPTSPQPSIATNTPFNYTLVHSIALPSLGSPTCISPLGLQGESFVVSWTDSSILIFQTSTGEQIIGMASDETYDGTGGTGINSVVVTSSKVETTGNAGEEAEGATGSNKDGGVEGVIISGHADRYVRFFDANSGQCTYSMLAHPDAISSLSLSPDGRELVSGGHDSSLRFWSLEKRSCIQEITSHRTMRGEGVVSVVWSSDGRWVVSGGGDGVVKVFGR